MSHKIYVAGPYEANSPLERESNVRHAIEVGEIIIKEGNIPFIPHLYHYWNIMHPHPKEYWMELDRQWLLSCDILYRLPGPSEGADEEVKIAVANGIPVSYRNWR